MLRDNLIVLRNMYGYSQEQIAEKIQISRQAYAKWEKGETIPDVEKCQRLAMVYGTTIDALLKTETLEGCGVLPPAPSGKHIFGSVTISERGQIVIPKSAREEFGLIAGEKLIVLGEEGEGLALVPARIFEEKLKTAMTYASIKADDDR